MAKELTYKKSTTITLKAVGDFDYENGTIYTEGEDYRLLDLMKDFNGAHIEVSVKIANNEDLDVPETDTQ